MGGHVPSRIGSFLTSCLKTILRWWYSGTSKQRARQDGMAAAGVVGGCGHRTEKSSSLF